MNWDLKREYIERLAREWRPEEYEIRVQPTRRELFEALGAGVLLVLAPRGAAAAEPTRLHFADDGAVTLLTGKMEMGQGSRTLLTQAVAEELRVPPERVRLVMGDTALTPDDGGTWASLTTPQTVPVVRRAAAEARRFREKLEAAPELTPSAQWKVLGQSQPPPGARDIVTGAKRYTGDFRLDGMRHGIAVGTITDASQAEAMAGVRIVREGAFGGVVAPTREAAEAAAGAVQAAWKRPEAPAFSTLIERFRNESIPPRDATGRYPAIVAQGDAGAALATAPHRHAAEYRIDYIAHAPLEPHAAIAEWNGDSLTVRGCIQAPFLVRQELAKEFGIPESKVRVIAVDAGGGFGGKQRGECAIEAARLARGSAGPVMVTWSREQEFQRAYVRPAGLITVESGFDSSGRLQAWRFRNYNSGAAGLKIAYAAPHVSCEFHRSPAPIPQGSYRSLAAAANNFARETHIDEIAALRGADPLELRLRNIEDGRLRAVLERAAERFGWGTRRGGAGVGFGLCCNLEKDGRLALFAEVAAEGRSARVRRLVAACDFGAALNPGNLKNQITGAIIQGIGGALFERYTSASASFSNYRVPRFSDVPEIDVILIDRRDVEPAGAGEAGITLTAPALGNALFSATGVRRRDLPLLG